MSGKALMTQYREGSLVTRELRDFLNAEAVTARDDKFNQPRNDDNETLDIIGGIAAAGRECRRLHAKENEDTET